MSALSTRTKLVGATIGAFLCGLVFASGLDLTRFGYAQSRTGASAQVATIPASAPPASVAALNGSFVDLAERLTPAVVSIEALRENRRAQGQRETPRGVPRGFEEFFEQFGDPRQRQQPNQASGSGFIVSRDGYILTNNHVVAEFDQVNVTLTDRRSFTAKVVGRDPTTDVAVLKIEGGNLPVAPLGNDANVRIGEWVLAIGNPLGLDFTVTAGIVSAKGRGSLDLPGISGADGYGITDMIQTDAAINPGNSGGPLVNIRGEVIGINAAIASNTGLYSGYGFAIPITLAKQVMDDIVAFGRVRRAVLGVQIDEVDPTDARAAGLTEIRGVKVQGFDRSGESPSQRAGLEIGDIIITAAGQRVNRISELQRIIRGQKPGDVVDIEVMRFGQRKTFRVRLGEPRPSNEQVATTDRQSRSAEPVANEQRSNDRLGISVGPIPAELAQRVGDEYRRGLLVTDVSVRGPAYRELFANRDIIVRTLNPVRKEIRTATDLEDVVKSLKRGDVVSLLVYDMAVGGTGSTKVVTLAIN